MFVVFALKVLIALNAVISFSLLEYIESSFPYDIAPKGALLMYELLTEKKDFPFVKPPIALYE